MTPRMRVIGGTLRVELLGPDGERLDIQTVTVGEGSEAERAAQYRQRPPWHAADCPCLMCRGGAA